MADDFETVNARRGERSREIEVLRQQYARQREGLLGLMADAPTDALAAEYQRLINDIERSAAKLDELEGRRPSVPPAEMSRPRVFSAPPPSPPAEATIREKTPELPGRPDPSSRALLIIGAGIVVLVVIGWLIWKSRDARSDSAREHDTSSTAPVVETDTAPVREAAPAASPRPAKTAVTEALKITPASADYGTIRKGTRAVRQFEVTNGGSEPIAIKVGRSSCRCLYYDYAEKIPAKGKETITVTVDGARAKSGALQQTVEVTSKTDPGTTANFNVVATIK